MKRQRDIERSAHRTSNQALPGDGGRTAASDRSQERGPLLRRVSVFGAGGAILIALSGLLGCVPGLGFLGSVRPGYIPMAPSAWTSP